MTVRKLIQHLQELQAANPGKELRTLVATPREPLPNLLDRVQIWEVNNKDIVLLISK